MEAKATNYPPRGVERKSSCVLGERDGQRTAETVSLGVSVSCRSQPMAYDRTAKHRRQGKGARSEPGGTEARRGRSVERAGGWWQLYGSGERSLFNLFEFETEGHREQWGVGVLALGRQGFTLFTYVF